MNETPDLESILQAVTKENSQLIKKIGKVLRRLNEKPNDSNALAELERLELEFYSQCGNAFDGIYARLGIARSSDAQRGTKLVYKNYKPLIIHSIFYEDQLMPNSFVTEVIFDRYYTAEADCRQGWIVPVSLDAKTFKNTLIEIAEGLKSNGYKNEGKDLLKYLSYVKLFVTQDDEEIPVYKKDLINKFIKKDFYDAHAATYSGLELHIDFNFSRAI